MKTTLVSMVAVVTLGSVPALAQSAAVDPQLLQQLQETIRHQQRQLEQQAAQIKAQAAVLQQLQQQVGALQAGQPAVTATTGPSEQPDKPSPALVTSGNDTIRLSLSGHINRAVNVVNDGGRTNLYHVDSNADNTRIRLVGTARVSDDLTLGSRLEFAVSADDSSIVSQDNQAPGSFINTKFAEISLRSKSFGTLYLGKGSSASDNTSAVDLSGTDIVLYSSIADIAGGIRFRQKNGVLSSSDTNLATVFDPLDGLGVVSRLRYDSPEFYGLMLSGSLVTNQRSDLTLTWGGEGYGFQAAAAFALANPKLPGAGLQYDGSYSLLHLASGLNLTLAGGLLEQKQRNDSSNLYIKLGWLANLIGMGNTAFGVDYTDSREMAAAGDKGYSVGGAVVQAFEKYATELYLQYRVFSLNRTAGVPVSDISVGTFGARVKF